MGAVANLVFVLVFAWLVRGLLGAREITWPRLLVAAVIGHLAGGTIAALLLVDVRALAADPQSVRIPGEQVAALAVPFQVLVTMLAVVGFELLFSRPPRRRELRPVRPLRALRRRLGIAARMAQVSRVATRHGLAPLLGLRRAAVSPRSPAELARRTRAALEDAGGTFIKLGQLLATRPDLLPAEALDELGRLHAAARPLSRGEVEGVLRDELGPLDEVFAAVDWEPLGSASIAQAHTARLRDGRAVVVKVRRPGLEDLVERDLAIAAWLARLSERRTSWGRAIHVTGLVDEFAATLRAELDFRNEAGAADEIAAAVAPYPTLRAPAIVAALSTERVLVMERLEGTPLSRVAPEALPVDARRLADDLCGSQVSAMLEGARFHGDPHPGNIVVLDDGTLGLIDFGVSGKLDTFERAAMFQLLLALKLEQPSLLHRSLVAVGAIDRLRDPEEVERALARFLAAHVGAGLPSPDALPELLRVLTRLGVRLPPQASTMFRALATLAGTLEHLSPGYPLIEQVAALGGAELQQRATPSSLGELVQREWADLGPLLRQLPRHADRLATIAAHGGLTARVRLFTEPSDVGVIERLVDRAVLTVVALGVALLSLLMLGSDTGPEVGGTGVRLLEVLGWFGLFVGTTLLLRVVLQVLRAEATRR